MIEDEQEQYNLQLYHYLVSTLTQKQNLRGLDILEVGSGRGGGISFIVRYMSPRSAIGIDIS